MRYLTYNELLRNISGYSISKEKIMPANFLIVCGGTGQGLVSERETLGFEGILQIDVDDQIIELNNDAKTVGISLPVEDQIAVAINSLTAIQSAAKRYESATKNSNNEVIEKLYAHHKQASKIIVPANLRAGMSQAPVIGRSYVTSQLPTQRIAEAISDMMTKGRLPNEMVVNFWLIASTCGGTGQGIIHHVADLVREQAQQYPGVTVQIKLVRIGSLTYNSLNQGPHLTTLWSVLSDYGFISRKIKEQTIGNVTYHTYYLDLPDVGVGEGAKVVRSAMVSSAFKALCEPKLNASFEEVLNNLNKANRAVFARVGEWGNQFNKESNYQFTLQQLNMQLETLLNPTHADLLVMTNDKLFWQGSIDSIFDQYNQALDEKLTQAEFGRMLESEIPRSSPISGINSVEEIFVHSEWNKYTELISALFPEQIRAQFERVFSIDLILTSDERRSITFGNMTNDDDYLSKQHIADLRLANIAIARIERTLFGTRESPGMLSELGNTRNALAPKTQNFWEKINIDINARKKAFKSNIANFVSVYYKVMILRRKYNESLKLRQNTRISYRNNRSSLQKLASIVKTQANNIRAELNERYITAVDISDEMQVTKTWIRLLCEVIDQNGEPISGHQSEERFRETVETGVRGFTMDGLAYVLQTSNPHPSHLAEILCTTNGANNPQWWRGQSPTIYPAGSQLQFFYRVIPAMSNKDEIDLRMSVDSWAKSTGKAAPKIVPVDARSFGLKVYSVECVAVDEFTIRQIQKLIAQLITQLNPSGNLFTGLPFTEEQLEDYYKSIMCMKSTGVPVYCPDIWGTDQSTDQFRQLYDSIHKLEDFFTIENDFGQRATD
jgi:hypothetical protein